MAPLPPPSKQRKKRGKKKERGGPSSFEAPGVHAPNRKRRRSQRDGAHEPGTSFYFDFSSLGNLYFCY